MPSTHAAHETMGQGSRPGPEIHTHGQGAVTGQGPQGPDAQGRPIRVSMHRFLRVDGLS